MALKPLNSFIIQPESYGATVDEGFIVGGPVGDFELLLCHGTVCVVGKMRDLILQLSKSSIYSTKPRKESGRQLMDALVTFLSRNHHNVIIEGVESEAHKEWLQGMEWFAIQGHYWREVSIEQLVADDIAM